MKTGDDTFDDIYVSKETGKVVGVMYEDVDYKLVPVEPKQSSMSYDQALNRAKKLLSMGDYVDGNVNEYANLKAVALVKNIYGREDEK
ncbi:hypothetical protein LJ555_11700 [Lacticaseibacillus paracasei]|uniref:hypothetical protein n=1 Tax=Lacticaseibacillus paracasei TaxID=1597 RepID=UPI0003437B47|nr:hypothetical protein [Lacticaseibacillus paracasei]EPC16881.1 hypothetical protein Lpp230_0873 [Lacticaseibacillus paracasei subsp. paracasei Lpp230]MCT3362075.1 hypothetical protein [Lacticaseibacillus paracasei]UNG77816.1 hypothetical protein LJ555_11700 [Lacticaseibacillus paracasei]